MAQYRLDIYINQNENEQTQIINPETQPMQMTQTGNTNAETMALGAMGSMTARFVATNVRAIASHEIAKISSVRGDYIKSANIENAMSIVGTGAGIAGAAASGAALGGPIGAAVAVATAVISEAVQLFQNMQTVQFEREIEAIDNAKAVNRLGTISRGGFR